jgi:hypothetical protein
VGASNGAALLVGPDAAVPDDGPAPPFAGTPISGGCDAGSGAVACGAEPAVELGAAAEAAFDAADANADGCTGVPTGGA